MGESPLIGLLLTFAVVIGFMIFIGNITEVPLLTDVPFFPDIALSTIWLGGIMLAFGVLFRSWLLLTIGVALIVHWYSATSITEFITFITNIFT